MRLVPKSKASKVCGLLCISAIILDDVDANDSFNKAFLLVEFGFQSFYYSGRF